MLHVEGFVGEFLVEATRMTHVVFDAAALDEQTGHYAVDLGVQVANVFLHRVLEAAAKRKEVLASLGGKVGEKFDNNG